MPDSRRIDRRDALALLTLIGTAVVIALPIVRDGYITYIDNTVHLVEIGELARSPNGWSEMSFTGFALGTLHSPLFYPALAWLARLGLPIGPLYCMLLIAGFAAPALAFYWVARRRIDAARAALLSYVVLVQSEMIWGIASPLGGMWTHGLAIGGVVVFAELMSRPRLEPIEHWWACVALSLVALTHLFALFPAVLVIAITTALLRRNGALERSEIAQRAFGWALAACASAAYWLTYALTTDQSSAPSSPLTPKELLIRVLLPSDVLYLLNHKLRRAISWDLYLTDAVPIVLLFATGFFGIVFLRKRQEVLGRLGFWLATVMLAGVFASHFTPLPVFGPVSWRLLIWVRLGMAFAAIPVVERLPLAWLSRRTAAMSTSCLAVASGFWWSIPLGNDIPDGAREEVRAAQNLAAWLKDHREPSWGRIYVQDTFGRRYPEGGWSRSHIPILVSEQFKAPMLGTYYGVVPYKSRWTLSEFSRLYNNTRPTAESLVQAMEMTNTGAIVTSNEETNDFIGKTRAFDKVHEVARYTVWRRRGAKDEPVDGLRPGNVIEHATWKPGEFSFDLTTEKRGRVLLKTSWHPWWRISGVPDAWLRENDNGFLVIDDIPAGHFKVRVWYAPRRLPWRVTGFGLAVLCVWALYLSMRKPKSLMPAKA